MNSITKHQQITYILFQTRFNKIGMYTYLLIFTYTKNPEKVDIDFYHFDLKINIRQYHNTTIFINQIQ